MDPALGSSTIDGSGLLVRHYLHRIQHLESPRLSYCFCTRDNITAALFKRAKTMHAMDAAAISFAAGAVAVQDPQARISRKDWGSSQSSNENRATCRTRQTPKAFIARTDAHLQHFPRCRRRQEFGDHATPSNSKRSRPKQNSPSMLFALTRPPTHIGMRRHSYTGIHRSTDPNSDTRIDPNMHRHKNTHKHPHTNTPHHKHKHTCIHNIHSCTQTHM